MHCVFPPFIPTWSTSGALEWALWLALVLGELLPAMQIRITQGVVKAIFASICALPTATPPSTNGEFNVSLAEMSVQQLEFVRKQTNSYKYCCPIPSICLGFGAELWSMVKKWRCLEMGGAITTGELDSNSEEIILPDTMMLFYFTTLKICRVVNAYSVSFFFVFFIFI